MTRGQIYDRIGAGAGSYEPTGTAAAVEPSAVMMGQRPAGSAPAVRAVAEALPFTDAAFDTSLAVLTTHHWTDPDGGLAELVRVSQRQVILTWDQAFTRAFWVLSDYLPEIANKEEGLAHLRAITRVWPEAEVHVVPVPSDCTDGFLAAYWRRPEAYLNPSVRAAISSLAVADPRTVAVAMTRLEQDLASGSWDRRWGHLRALDELDCGYRVVVRSGH
jgi:SAM-dependent methyltransferase